MFFQEYTRIKEYKLFKQSMDVLIKKDFTF